MMRPKDQTEEHYQIILDSIADGVFTVNLDFKVTSFNNAAEKITGIPKSEAIGRPCFEVLRANTCETNCLLRSTIDTHTCVVNTPIYIVRADNKRIPISVTTAILRNSEGRIIGGVETFRDLRVVHRLKKALFKRHSFEDIITKDEKMGELFAVLPQIAESRSTVLIQGASGTGKELIARAIHNNSLRKNGPFVAVNCGALPDTLCESELFGYKAGAFTDAKKDKPGRFALAHNGTIFLDEIGDISQAVQIRLLRVLEEKVYEPLGSTKAIPTNARVIAATHQDLEQRVADGLFREDLYFRINVMKVMLPPLADRKGDIPILVDHFVERFNHLTGRKIVGVSREALATLMLYDWPGNVRELENAIEHAFVLCDGELIHLRHLPDRIVPRGGPVPAAKGRTLKAIEESAIRQALERNRWKRVRTAEELGIDKNTLRRKMKRLGITPPT
jgi:PAS domain S-box-containing protein